MKLTNIVTLLTLLLMAAPLASAEPSGPLPLRELADRRGFDIGASVVALPLREEPKYAEVLAREYNLLTVANSLKFSMVHPERDRYDFADADFIVNFGLQHGLRVRGHTLLWHKMEPGWLKNGQFTRDESIAILGDHIKTVVERYRGRIYAWDVVNEAIEDSGGWRDSTWFRAVGSDYVDLAFRMAHEADPDALLFYNDFGAEGMNAKSDAVYEMVRGMLERGVPIHGVGLQMHVQLGAAAWADDLARNIRRLNALGLEVQITEFDVRLPMPPPPDSYKSQANIHRKMLRACLDAPNCTAFITWGFTDKHSWIPRFFGGFGAALPFDEQYNPKPAYEAMSQELGREEVRFEVY